MSIGVCLAQLRELAHTVRSQGVDGDRLDRIEAAIEAMAAATGARRPTPPRNALGAALAQMLVLEEELRPRRLAAYGALEPDAARALDRHVQRLVDLTVELIADTEKGQ